MNLSAALNQDILIFTDGERRVFKRKEKLTVWQHAEKTRVITDGNIKGPWRNNVTPYTVGPMHCWTMPSIRKIFLLWAPQTAKTQVAFNCMCYSIEHDGMSIMYVMPDEKVAKRISRRRITPMFKNSPAMRELLSPRFDDTTTLAINFTNGADLMMAWATSAAELSSESVPILILDERDKFPNMAGREIDPTAAAEIRATTFPHTSKVLEISTPDDETGIVADIEAEADTIYHYQAKCPICGEYQKMEFEQIFLSEEIKDPREIIRRKLGYYQCKTCGMSWNDFMRNQAVLDGLANPESLYGWVPDRIIENPIAVAFHLPSWYSPFVSLSRIKAAEIRGNDNRAKQKVFITQHKAEPWKEIIEKPKKEDDILKARCDLPTQTVPETAVALTCGIDVQKRGFWFAVWAWKRENVELTGWKIHHGALGTWDEVGRLLFETEYPIADGSGSMRIWRAALDTGGGRKNEDETMTDETYFWIIDNYYRGVELYGTKGSSRPIAGRICKQGKELMQTRTGKKLPPGFHVVLIDTNQAKDKLHEGLRRAAANEPHALYLDKDTDTIFARHILAEEKILDPKTKRPIWDRKKPDNHLLDASCCALVLAHRDFILGGVNILAPRVVQLQPQPNIRAQRKEQKIKKSGRWS
jgi:phage terminase large subunit GpA-like protein